ncbi:unnamed protein product, partial [Durusdinium trenchii]
VRTIPTWFQLFLGLEREAIENTTAKLFRAKAVIDMNRPKAPSMCTSSLAIRPGTESPL